MNTLDYALAALAVFLCLKVWKRSTAARGAPLPPGPKPLPIIGNLRDKPTDHEWLTYSEWKRQYGPIVYVRMLHEDVIIINEHKLALEILEKNSTVYADRPPGQTMIDMIGWTNGVAFSPHGDRHRQYRKLLAGRLSPTATKQSFELQQSTAKSLLRELLDHPEDFQERIRDTLGNSLVTLTFGENILPRDFNYIERADDAHGKFSLAGTPYAFAVDFVPFLKYIPSWFPGMKWKRDAEAWRAELLELVRVPYELVKAKMAQGTAGPSYVAKCLETMGELTAKTESTIMWTAASLYTGGSDTTATSLTTFFLVMILFPDVQAKAQEEIDRVVGTDRLPTHDDRASLPYINALVKELLRWRQVTPLGITHCAREDKIVEGYFIPKGASVIANIWEMLHDENIYKDPFSFKPERFLGPDAEPDYGNLPFGFGRRICPGMHLADASLFVYTATILASFNIGKPKDKEGNFIEQDVEYSTGIVSVPGPFSCTIKPRSPTALANIMRD